MTKEELFAAITATKRGQTNKEAVVTAWNLAIEAAANSARNNYITKEFHHPVTISIPSSINRESIVCLKIQE